MHWSVSEINPLSFILMETWRKTQNIHGLNTCKWGWIVDVRISLTEWAIQKSLSSDSFCCGLSFAAVLSDKHVQDSWSRSCPWKFYSFFHLIIQDILWKTKQHISEVNNAYCCPSEWQCICVTCVSSTKHYQTAHPHSATQGALKPQQP